MMILSILASLSLSSPAPNPRALVDSAIAAMQRSTSLRNFHSLRLVGIQHEFVFGNAERAEGPWRTSYAQFTELRDVDARAMRRTESALLATGGKGPERVTIVSDSVVAVGVGGRQTGVSRSFFEDFIDRIEGTPDRALSLAAASTELRYETTVRRYGNTLDVVSFPWRNGRMRLELNRETHLPDALDIVRPYPDNFRLAEFGDVTKRTDFVDWQIMPNGSYWPMQLKMSINGDPARDVTFASATLSTDVVSRDSFVVADSARAQAAAASKLDFSRFRLGMRGQPSELAPGIVRVPDQWTQTLVKQPDGVVIFEAHISAQYLHDVMGEAKKRWPSAPIKALIMTSDPWAHLGGVREAMALGIPVYVSAAGDNRIELYPAGGPYAERMLMAYFPDKKLLYGADLVFPNRGPDGKITKGFFETSAVDLRRAVAREKLAVDSLFSVQNYPVMAWSTFSEPVSP